MTINYHKVTNIHVYERLSDGLYFTSRISLLAYYALKVHSLSLGMCFNIDNGNKLMQNSFNKPILFEVYSAMKLYPGLGVRIVWQVFFISRQYYI